MTYATFNSSPRTQDALRVAFHKPLSAIDIAAMKAQVEGNYKVAFLYSGVEFDYTVILEGSTVPVTHALNTLFPKGRDDILIQRATDNG